MKTAWITVYYHSIDNHQDHRRFKTLVEAQEWAQHWVGRWPTIGHFCGYAISDDGIGKITVDGCKITELFPEAE